MGGRIFSRQVCNSGIPLISCSDRSLACCHAGHPSIHSGFCQREVPDSVFGGFYCLQPCVFAQCLHLAVKQPSHPKNSRGERDLQKNISRFPMSFTAQEKRARALNLIISTLKLEPRIVPPRVWNHPSHVIMFKLCLPGLKSALLTESYSRINYYRCYHGHHAHYHS